MQGEAATGGVLLKKGVFKNFSYVAGKHLCLESLLMKSHALFKDRLRHWCFPVKFVNF